MKTWIRRCSVVGLLAAAGCGGPPEEAAEDAVPLTVTPAAPPAAARPPQASRAPQVGPARAAELGREARVPATALPSTLEFEATHLPGSGDPAVRLVAGMMSCGFWKVGEGRATLSGGRASARLTLDAQANGAQGFSVYFYVDRDQDGACGPGDDVYEAPLPQLPAGGPVSVDASALPATYAGCWLFDL